MWSIGLVSVTKREAAFCTRCNGLMSTRKACEYSVAIVESVEYECRDPALGDFSPAERRIWRSCLNWKKQLLTTRLIVLLHRQLIVEVDASISDDFDRLDDVITDWKCQVSRRQLAQVSTPADPLQLRFQRIQLESTSWAPISNVISDAAAQLMTNGVDFRDLTRSVELFVVSEQVMTEKIAWENIFDVLGVGDEFYWF